MNQPEIVTLKSRRRVAVHRLAEGNGERTVVFCHPAPGAGNFDPDPKETAKRKVTLIAVDRPGYGNSQPVKRGEWASVDKVADDLAEVLHKMKTGPVGVAGWSAGGRIALALAARHPELVDRLVIIATPAPDEAVPWIPAEQKQGLEALRDLASGQSTQPTRSPAPRNVAKESSTEAFLSLLGPSPADDKALKMPGASTRLAAMMQAAFAQGASGMAADIAGYCLPPWGFKPSDVKAKTLCLYGSRDPIAGSRHGVWWQKNLPQARLEMVPGAGHLLVIPMWQRVLSHLAPGRTKK